NPDECIVRALTGRATPGDLAHIDRWRRASAENERHYLEFVGLWRMAAAHPSASVRGEAPTAEEVLRAPSQATRQPPEPMEAGQIRRVAAPKRRRVMAAAAA